MNEEAKKMTKTIGGVIALIFLVILFFVVNPLVIVEEGNRGVIIEWGNATGEVLEPGMHWVTPIAEDVVEMDVTKQKDEGGASTASKDLQTINTQIAVNYRLDPTKVDQIYTTMKKRYSSTVIKPTISEFVKKVTAKFTAAELVQERQAVKDKLYNQIKNQLAKEHIIVDDVYFTNFSFSKKFDAAIEEKVTAEQRAQEAKRRLEKVKYQAQQKVEKAQAKAEAIKKKAEAINQKGGANYVKLRWVKKWDGKLPKQFVPGQSLPFLNAGATGN